MKKTTEFHEENIEKVPGGWFQLANFKVHKKI